MVVAEKRLSIGPASRRAGFSAVWMRELVRRGEVEAEETPLGLLFDEAEIERLIAKRAASK